METLEKLTKKKEEVEPAVEEAMEEFLGVSIKQINEDISNKLIQGNIDYDVDVSIPFKEAKEKFKKAFLIRLLQHTNGNISETARIAGLDRRSIHRLIEKYDIKVDALREQPYYFSDDKKKMYVKDVVDKTLKEYEITKEKELDEKTSKEISTKIPDIRLTMQEAIDLFEMAYFEKAVETYKTEKEIAKRTGLRYETVHKKLKMLQ